MVSNFQILSSAIFGDSRGFRRISRYRNINTAVLYGIDIAILYDHLRCLVASYLKNRASTHSAIFFLPILFLLSPRYYYLIITRGPLVGYPAIFWSSFKQGGQDSLWSSSCFGLLRFFVLLLFLLLE